jgi:REP element-mobilizing transposase RayT
MIGLSLSIRPSPRGERFLLSLTFMKKQRKIFILPKNCKFFGGETLIGNRKSQRPICGRQALHVVIRSQWAFKKTAFTHKENIRVIEDLILDLAQKYKIRIYRFAIVSNHIHIILKTSRRWRYRCHICVLTGQVAQHVMRFQSFENFKKRLAGEGYRQKRGQHHEQQFWEFRPFSRIIEWGRDFKRCMKYTLRNTLESMGIIPYKERQDHYHEWRVKFVPA